MKDRIRKSFSQFAHTPMEIIRRRQAENTVIATVGLQMPHSYKETLGGEPSLQEVITFFGDKPDGDYYLSLTARLPTKLAMARRVLRAIKDQEDQLTAITEVLHDRRSHHGVIESFWRRRLQRQIAHAAIGIVTSPVEPDDGILETLGIIDESDHVQLPEDVVTTVRDRSDRIDDIATSFEILGELFDKLQTQQQKDFWGDREDD